MRSFRAKPVGWRGDSHRHYLAAKGISTKYMAKKNKFEQKYGLFTDNPGGDWLERTKARAASGKFSGSVTAGSTNLPVSVEELAQLPGEMGEEKRIHESEASRENIDRIKASIEKDGFKENSGPLIWVKYDGTVTVAEGNHRIQAAKELGIKELPVQVRWFAGSEDIEGKWNIDKIKENLENKK